MKEKKQAIPYLWATGFCYRVGWFDALAILVTSITIALLPASYVWLVQYIATVSSTGQSLALAFVLAVLLFAGDMMLKDLKIYFRLHLDNKVKRAVHGDYFEVLTHYPARNYNDAQAMARLRQARDAVNDPWAINSTYDGMINLLMSFIAVASLTLSLWQLNHQVAFVAILAPIPMLLNFKVRGHFHGKAYPVLTEYKRRLDYLANLLNLQRFGYDLATLNGLDAIASKAQDLNQQHATTNVKYEVTTALVEALTALFNVLLFTYCIYTIAQAHELSAVVATVAGLLSYMSLMKITAIDLNTLATVKAPANNLKEFLAQLATFKTNAPQTVTVGDKITFNKVTVAYDTKVAVDGVTLELNKGGYTALVGMNGCGKTSFFKAIMGVQLNAQGQVTTDSDSYDLSDSSKLLPCACVQQEYGRYEVTVRQYLTLGLTYQATEAQLEQALRQVGMLEIVAQLPQQLDTLLGEQWQGGVNLSGGQWQRLAIARSFLATTPVLYLDEPTSAIDAQAEEEIFKEIAQVSKQRLVLLTTHRVSTLKDAQMIYVMRDGKIVEQGTFNQLNQPGSYFQELFASQLVV